MRKKKEFATAIGLAMLHPGVSDSRVFEGGCKLKQARVTKGQVRGHVGTVTGIISSTSCETLMPAVPV